jgi:hypothetical protein
MKTILLLVFISFWNPAFSQGVALSRDSSAIVFPNKVTIALQPTETNKFELTHPALDALLLQCNYITATKNLKADAVKLYEVELGIRDSIIATLTKELAITNQRTAVYSDAYDKSRLITTEYDTQMQTLIKDLSKLRSINRADKRKSFLKGVASGVLAGGLLGVILTIEK